MSVPTVRLVAAAIFASLAMAATWDGAIAAELPQDSISKEPFGSTPDGIPVDRYLLRNRQGMEARIITYGGIVTHLMVPDRKGALADVVLGFDTLAGYLKSGDYMGALIGRYAGRIARGQFTLKGAAYTLTANDPPNALHGGVVGFNKVVWKAVEARVGPAGPRLTLAYLSRDGEEGYPGNLAVNAVYTLTDDNALRLDYTASTDKETVVNLTHHSYFNLRGRGDILSHIVRIRADRFTAVDDTRISTGELRRVTGTPFDFRRPTVIGARMGAADEQLRLGKGYDVNYVIDKPAGALAVMATVYEPESGRVLEVASTDPGLEFYTGNFLDGSDIGKRGTRYRIYTGFCMEPQHFPDSPNHPDFPSTVLEPGRTYHNTIVFRLSAR